MAFCVCQIFWRNFQKNLTTWGQFLVKYSLYWHHRTFRDLPVLPLLLNSPSSSLSGQTTTIHTHKPPWPIVKNILQIAIICQWTWFSDSIDMWTFIKHGNWWQCLVSLQSRCVFVLFSRLSTWHSENKWFFTREKECKYFFSYRFRI